MVFWLALRVAIVSAFSSHLAMKASTAASNAPGSSPRMRRVNSPASYGCTSAYDANSAFQARSSALPLVLASQAV
ncbi:hypothetical protein D3C87_1721740 [compost metagenome]